MGSSILGFMATCVYSIAPNYIEKSLDDVKLPQYFWLIINVLFGNVTYCRVSDKDAYKKKELKLWGRNCRRILVKGVM